jgi:hypothetical protein
MGREASGVRQQPFEPEHRPAGRDRDPSRGKECRRRRPAQERRAEDRREHQADPLREPDRGHVAAAHARLREVRESGDNADVDQIAEDATEAEPDIDGNARDRGGAVAAIRDLRAGR